MQKDHETKAAKQEGANEESQKQNSTTDINGNVETYWNFLRNAITIINIDIK